MKTATILMVVLLNLMAPHTAHAIYPIEYYIDKDRARELNQNEVKAWNDLRNLLAQSTPTSEEFDSFKNGILRYRFKYPTGELFKAYIQSIDALWASLHKSGGDGKAKYDSAAFKALVDAAYHAIQIAPSSLELRRAGLKELKSLEDRWLACENMFLPKAEELQNPK